MVRLQDPTQLPALLRFDDRGAEVGLGEVASEFRPDPQDLRIEVGGLDGTQAHGEVRIVVNAAAQRVQSLS
jgi:hypothetical protein